MAAAHGDVAGRVAQIKREIEDTDSDWDREKLQERLAKFAGGVAVVKVGAATEVELKEKKHRIEDALSATRAAIDEGIVAGGGTALVRARVEVDKLDRDPRQATRQRVRASWRTHSSAAASHRRQRWLRGCRQGARSCRRQGLDWPQRRDRRTG